jgi:SAM-dependent methyltransferase
VFSVSAFKAALPARYKSAGRGTYLRLASVLNVGSRLTCPCCGRHFRKFARFHGINDQCPGCGSLMRQRALVLYLRDVLRLPATDYSVLHVGPAPCMRDWFASLPDVRSVSVDITPGVADTQADVTDLPFEGGSFDLVVCVHVLEHVPNDRSAIAELQRVLRPGGCAVIQVPPSPLRETFEDFTVTSPEERERLFGQYDHVRLCGADYPLRLEAAGFDVAQVDYVEELDLSDRRIFGLFTGEPFYLCKKPTEDS